MHLEMLGYEARRAAATDLPIKPEEAKREEPLQVTLQVAHAQEDAHQATVR